MLLRMPYSSPTWANAAEVYGGIRRCPAQNLPLQLPFLLRLGQTLVLCTRPDQLVLRAVRFGALPVAEPSALRTQERSVSGSTFRSATTPLNVRLPAGARHNA